MSSWLAEAKNLAVAGTEFVLATVWSKTGYSPDDIGARLLITNDDVIGKLNSDHRQQNILHSARQILNNRCPVSIEQFPLGNILGSENGSYEVLFNFFPKNNVPNWMERASQLQQEGRRFVLSQRIDRADEVKISCSFRLFHDPRHTDNSISTPALNILDSFLPPLHSELHKEGTKQFLLQMIDEPTISIGVLGSSRVADCLVKQLSLLPLSIHWFASKFDRCVKGSLVRAPLQDSSLEALPQRARLVIATGNHRADLHYCRLGLLSTNVAYVGCIGSVKKAEIIRSHLIQQGVPQQLVDGLHIPIGLRTIKGKQPQFVAASIVAQLLSFRENR